MALLVSPIFVVMKSRIRQLLFGRLILTLALLLGVMQVVVGHWVTVVLAGREGPGLGVGLVLAALLVAANAIWCRCCVGRGGAGAFRVVARAYMASVSARCCSASRCWRPGRASCPSAACSRCSESAAKRSSRSFAWSPFPSSRPSPSCSSGGSPADSVSVEHTHVRIPLEDLHEALRGLRIVQISDLHIGNGMEGERLARMVARVNALEPDLLALTGDIFDFDPAFLERGAPRTLAGLRARHGVFAVLGNHDTYTGPSRWQKLCATTHPIAPASREVVRARSRAPLRGGNRRSGARLDGPECELPALDALAAAPLDGPMLLLVHRPESFPQASRLGFPVVLAGHTHGGQIAFPTPVASSTWPGSSPLPPRSLPRNGSTLYVNRGIGVAGPAIRLNCAREIATIELARSVV